MRAKVKILLRCQDQGDQENGDLINIMGDPEELVWGGRWCQSQ